MKYIISKQDGQLQELQPYLIRHIGKYNAVIELDDQVLKQVKDNFQAIEPDFKVALGDLQWQDLGVLRNEKVILVTVGKYYVNEHIQYLYEMNEEKWQEQNSLRQQAVWIHCYGDKEELEVSKCLYALEKLYKLGDLLNRPVLIVGNIKSQLPYFKKGSLAQKIVEQNLINKKNLIVLQAENNNSFKFHPAYFEQTLRHIVYTNESAYKVQSVMKRWLMYKESPSKLREARVRQSFLYDDIFYKQIPTNQPIYVPLNLLENEEPAYYENLGLHPVYIGKQHMMLYDERQQLDSRKEELDGIIYPNYECPILTRAPLIQAPKMIFNQTISISSQTEFTGKGVYIGVITTEGIDYTNPFLRNSEGKTKIKRYWIQDTGDEGTYYREDQINEALMSNGVNESVPLEVGENYVSALLGVASGRMSGYQALATEAEFLVAKIQTAPKSLQSIYGGSTEPIAVLMPDVLIAAYKMLKIAETEQRPIVLIIPYNTNLSSHDGTGIYEQLLAVLGKQQGCTIVVPTGEEGNKNHHQTIVASENIVPNITLQISSQVEAVVGSIYLSNDVDDVISLYDLQASQNRIPLKEEGIYTIGNSVVYTTGLINNYQNGANMIHFRMVNIQPSPWRLEYATNIVNRDAKIDIWLAQQELNPYVTLSPSTPFITIGSTAAIDSVLTTGSYDYEDLIVLAASGRGYNWRENIVPNCVTQGRGEVIFSESERYEIQGTAVAASLLAGAVAMLYEKQTREGEAYANSLLMHSKILKYVERFVDVSYPNPIQGYGIFNIRDFAEILKSQ